MWQINGSAMSYTGTHTWYGADYEKPGGESTWTITNNDPTSFTLRFCTVSPGDGPPTFYVAGNPVGGTICNELKRVLPPAPKPTFASVVSLQGDCKCRSRRDFRIRLRAPKADPLVRATVQVNGKQVRVLAGTRLTAPVNLRGLPTGRYAVKIVATTASGRVIQGTRHYARAPQAPVGRGERSGSGDARDRVESGGARWGPSRSTSACCAAGATPGCSSSGRPSRRPARWPPSSRCPSRCYELTGSTSPSGCSASPSSCRSSLLALVGGALADAFDRRRLIALAEVGALHRGARARGQRAARRTRSVWVLYVGAALSAACDALLRPPLDALEPRLVERDELKAAFAIKSALCETWRRSAARRSAGLLIVSAGYAATYGVDAASFVGLAGRSP